MSKTNAQKVKAKITAIQAVCEEKGTPITLRYYRQLNKRFFKTEFEQFKQAMGDLSPKLKSLAERAKSATIAEIKPTTEEE